MKILKPGRTFSPAWQMTCNHCGCEFAFNESDIDSDREGSHIICPNTSCGRFLAPNKTAPYNGAATYHGPGPGGRD